MTESYSIENTSLSRSVTTKVLAIIGFVATIILILYLIGIGISRAPSSFGSLASIAKSIGDYRPIEKLEVTAKQTVVNSKESFEIMWTDMKQTGEYHVSYACIDGVTLLVRAEDGSLVPMKCNDKLSLPHNVHGLYLSIESGVNRFADVPLTVRFTNTEGKELLSGNTKVTVVNAQIPVGGSLVEETPDSEGTQKPDTATTTENVKPTPNPVPQPKPIVTTVIPTSDPHGNVDLAVTMLGNGIMTRNGFVFTPAYDRNAQNAIRFMIKNIGTKTSNSWSFTTTLPDKQSYESETLKALKPQEYVEYTIAFSLDEDTDNLVTIRTDIETDEDVKSSNDDASWSVVVWN